MKYALKTLPSPDDSALTHHFKTLSAKGKAAMREKHSNGETMHLAPLGWLNTRDDKGRSIIVPDPERYELVQEAKRLRAVGMSIRKICAVMDEKGLRSQRGKVIGPSSMLKLLNCSPESSSWEIIAKQDIP